MSLQRLFVSGFKSLVLEQAIELGRVNCFIGANGVGKSNILEALGVLGAAANGVVDDESLIRRGVRPSVADLYRSSFRDVKAKSRIEFSAVNAKDASYSAALIPDSTWQYKDEHLFDGQRDVIATNARLELNLNDHMGYAALKKIELDNHNAAVTLMRDLQEFGIYSPNTPTLRGVTPDPQSRQPLGLNGGNLADGFKLLQQYLSKLGAEGEVLLEQVLELIDWLQDVEVVSQANRILSASVPRTKSMLKFTDRHMVPSRSELSAYDASEGALYVLFTAILCLLPQAPKVFAIDNLDQALNPRLLAKLVNHLNTWLKRDDRQGQLLFTAHNPAVLDGLDLADTDVRLFAVERNNKGQTRVRRIELSERLIALNNEYPLSRLWLMGHLGAMPDV